MKQKKISKEIQVRLWMCAFLVSHHHIVRGSSSGPEFSCGCPGQSLISRPLKPLRALVWGGGALAAHFNGGHPAVNNPTASVFRERWAAEPQRREKIRRTRRKRQREPWKTLTHICHFASHFFNVWSELSESWAAAEQLCWREEVSWNRGEFRFPF